MASLLLLSFSHRQGRLRDFTFSALDETVFQVFTAVRASARGCLFPHSAEVWLHFGRANGAPFAGILT